VAAITTADVTEALDAARDKLDHRRGYVCVPDDTVAVTMR